MKQCVGHGCKFLDGSWGLMGIAVVSDLPAWVSAFPKKKYPESLRRWLRNPGTKSSLIDGIAQMFEDRWSNQRNSKKRSWDFSDEVDDDDDDNDVLTLSSSRRGGVQRFSDDEDDDWDKGAASSVASKSDGRLAGDDWDDTLNTPKMKRQLFAFPTAKGSNTVLGAQASSPVQRSRRGTDMETFVLEEEDEDDDPETEKIRLTCSGVQWPRGAVVQAVAVVKHARDVTGDKKQSMSKEEFQNLLSSTPVAVLALKGLDKTPAQSHDRDAEAGQSQKTSRQVRCNVRRRRRVFTILNSLLHGPAVRRHSSPPKNVLRVHVPKQRNCRSQRRTDGSQRRVSVSFVAQDTHGIASGQRLHSTVPSFDFLGHLSPCQAAPQNLFRVVVTFSAVTIESLRKKWWTRTGPPLSLGVCCSSRTASTEMSWST